MRDIRATVEVRSLIGADKLRELHEGARERYECWQCGRTGRTTVPASVIVLAYREFPVVKLAHAGCADPHIIEVDAAGMRTVAGQIPVPQHRQRAQGDSRLKAIWLARRLGRLDVDPLRRISAIDDYVSAWRPDAVSRGGGT